MLVRNESLFRTLYSEHCTQNIVNNNKTQYKQANVTAVATVFENGKLEVTDFCVNLPLTHI